MKIVRKILVASGLYFVFVTLVAEAAVGTLTDGVLTYDIASATTESATFASYGTVTNVVKKGAGKLTVTADNSGYTGTIVIEAGTFYGKNFSTTAKKDLSIGSAKTVTVKGGGAFNYYENYGWNSASDYHPDTTFYFEGAGPDGKGALLYDGTAYGERSYKRSVMTGPATVGGSRGPLYVSLNMNGHTLTNRSNNFLYSYTPANPGSIVNLAKWTFGSSSKCEKSGDLFYLLGSGATLMYWSYTGTFTRPVTVEGNAVWTADDGTFGYTTTGKNTCAAPVNLTEGSCLTFQHQQYVNTKIEYASQRFTGVISGAGAVSSTLVSGKAPLRTYLNAKNTYTGGTSVSGSEIWGIVDESVPTAGGLSLTGGKLNLLAGITGGWTAEHIHDAYAACRTPAAGGAFCIMTPFAATSFTDSLAWTNDFGVLSHNGPGTCTLSGTFGTDSMHFYNHAGTFKITAAGQGLNLGSVTGVTGSVVFEDAGFVWTSNRHWRISSSAVNPPRLVLKGNTVMAGMIPASGVSGKPYTKLCLGDSSGQRAIVEIQDGATLTNLVNVGDNGGSAGAIYQSGGTLYHLARACYDGLIGDSGYGYYGQTGGKLDTSYAIWFGKRPGSTGIWEMSGGTASIDGTSTIGGAGTGVVYQTAGAISWKERATLCAADYTGDEAPRLCAGVLTLDGPEARFDMTGGGNLNFGQRTNSVAQINLNAGRLSCKVIERRDYRTDSLKGNTPDAMIPTCRGYLNFNGGTLAARANGAIVKSATRTKLDKVTVYERGATLDVAGYAVDFPLPLAKPEGYGVQSLAFETPAAVTNFIGAQAVHFSGGTLAAIPATALVPFDAATGKLKAPVVTSAGQGFAADDTVTASIPGCRYSGAHKLSVTLAPLASGGLTVTNSSASAGTLTLGAVNTYTGATHVCRGATLKLGVADAIAASSALAIDAGATLDLNGMGAMVLDTFSGSGAVTGGDVTVTNALVFTAADVMADKVAALSGKLTLGANVTLTVKDVPADIPEQSHTLLTAAGGIEGPVPTLVGFEGTANPGFWKLVKRGNSLRLRFERGFVLLLR